MKRFLLIAFTALTLTATPARAEFGAGGAVDIPDKQGDAVVAAGTVTISGRVSGDALIAAGTAILTGEVGDDMRVMSGEYKQVGDVGGELAVASGKVDIDGLVANDLYVGAEDVRLGPDARVGKDARIAGEDVLIKGRIDGDLDVAGETVAISAQIGGNVTIRARQITFGPDTAIEGVVKWEAASEPDVSPDAIINGEIKGQVVEKWDRDGGWSWDKPWRVAPREAMFAGEAAYRGMMAISAFLVGLLLILLTPNYARRAADTIRGRWPAALGFGFLVVIAAPAISLLLLFTIIGIPLGLLGLLAYPLMLLWGYAAGAASLGMIAMPGGALTAGRRVVALALGLAVLTAIAFIPVIGFFAGLAATLLGLGALILALTPKPMTAS